MSDESFASASEIRILLVELIDRLEEQLDDLEAFVRQPNAVELVDAVAYQWREHIALLKRRLEN